MVLQVLASSSSSHLFSKLPAALCARMCNSFPLCKGTPQNETNDHFLQFRHTARDRANLALAVGHIDHNTEEYIHVFQQQQPHSLWRKKCPRSSCAAMHGVHFVRSYVGLSLYRTTICFKLTRLLGPAACDTPKSRDVTGAQPLQGK